MKELQRLKILQQPLQDFLFNNGDAIPAFIKFVFLQHESNTILRSVTVTRISPHQLQPDRMEAICNHRFF